MTEITLRKPDDMHLHLRDNDALATTVPETARTFGRAIVMPNLTPPVIDVQSMLAYKSRIEAHIPIDANFTPLMTLYFTDKTTPKLITDAAKHPDIIGIKLYPKGATTNSASGVTDFEKIVPALEAMQATGLPLLIHGEVTTPSVDIFDREKIFIDTILTPIIKKFPKLKIVLEHITTKEAVDFVLAQPTNVAATITLHHLLLNRNDLLAGGIFPHHYCLPILKRSTHQEALIAAALSGNSKFFLGTDSAPHAQNKKESNCGCAGIFTSHVAIELTTQLFEQHNALEKLENFTSTFGAQFYGLPLNEQTITLTKQPWQVPESYTLGSDTLIPFAAGKTIEWKIKT